MKKQMTRRTPEQEHLAKIEARLARLAEVGILERDREQMDPDGTMLPAYRVTPRYQKMPMHEAVAAMAAACADLDEVEIGDC